MAFILRDLQARLARALGRGKSVLLLGARQTGKTTLAGRLGASLSLSFASAVSRQRYERAPQQLADELDALCREVQGAAPPLVVLDEVQRWPACLDIVQEYIDRGVVQFVLTGSSARKLRRGRALNLLPGRLVHLQLDPLCMSEGPPRELDEQLFYGSLPGICRVASRADRDEDLASYVTAYLEQEIRAEALVRNVGAFAQFLELAASESGNILNAVALSKKVGVSAPTIRGYYEIMEDCLVAERIEPLTDSPTRHRLTRAPRYLFFDLGVRRACAQEGTAVTAERRGQLFEQFVGLELIRASRLRGRRRAVHFWRDPSGPEVDYVLRLDDTLVPVEVKWTDTPTRRDARHVQTFLAEYPAATQGFVICRVPRPTQLSDRVRALPWQALLSIL